MTAEYALCSVSDGTVDGCVSSGARWLDWRDDVTARSEYAALWTSFECHVERPPADFPEEHPPSAASIERPHGACIDMSSPQSIPILWIRFRLRGPRETILLSEHREITIVTAGGETLVYKIFNVRWTNAWDCAYTARSERRCDGQSSRNCPGKQPGFVLATCSSVRDRNARMLVHAALHVHVLDEPRA